MIDICLSGGAKGADVQWGVAAAACGHRVRHYSFNGHVTATSKDVVRLTQNELSEVDWHLERANRVLQRRYPPDNLYVRNLLRRNWFQVDSAKSLYAVSSFKHGQVVGGTAWAVILFLLKFDMASCPAYVFDQERCFWYDWVGEWRQINEPPKPCDVYAGVGTRAINPMGRLAIKVLMDYRMDYHTTIRSRSEHAVGETGRLVALNNADRNQSVSDGYF